MTHMYIYDTYIHVSYMYTHMAHVYTYDAYIHV